MLLILSWIAIVKLKDIIKKIVLNIKKLKKFLIKKIKELFNKKNYKILN